jgi:hypothetical protein
MDDGTVLLADRWVAEAARDRPQPTVLVRSCYGRGQTLGLDYFYGLLYGRLLAERGLQVVMQSVRGTFGSGGTFNPFDERADGLATLRWLREQPWHRGPIGMAGQSYLGLAQWAVAPEAGDDLAALSIQGSASQFHGQSYPGGSIALETSVQWLVLIATQERRPAVLPMLHALRRLPSVLSGRSLRDLDLRAGGKEVAWFREALSHPGRDDEWWVKRDFSAGVEQVTAPVQMITGWYDAFTPWQLEDFAALQQAGRRPQLIIGPWTHTQEEMAAEGVREGVAWLRGHLLDDWGRHNSTAVRIYVTGERAGGGWRELERWPPDENAARRLWLASEGRLAWATPDTAAAGSRTYRYDPADPTPSVGGPVMLSGKPVLDNRELESRADVITFTSAPLDEPVEAIGLTRVELFARASAPYFDLFARVCDVDVEGASWNVCDALASVAPGRFERSDEDGSWRVEFDLWPIAHRFAAGHRIRLQVSSGAHPRYARNPGTGEGPLEAESMLPVDVELLHGPDHRSSVVLPVISPRGPA